MAEQLPRPVEGFYRITGLHDPVVLYAGRIRTGDADTHPELEGVVELRWLPTPQVSCRYWATEQASSLFLNRGQISIDGQDLELLDLPPGGVPQQPLGPPTDVPTTAKFWGEVEIDPREVGGGSFDRLVVNIVNFAGTLGDFLAERIDNGGTVSEWRGRIELNSPQWHILLDGRAEFGDLHKSAASAAGFAVTHVAELRRQNGSQFSPADALEVLEAFRRFLSFVNGAIVGWALPTGIASNGEPVWSCWGATVVSRSASRLSWHDDHHVEQVQELFPKFMVRWDDGDWNGVVSRAISYYLEANDGFVEKRLVMACAALEMLAWTVLFEDQDWLRKDDLGRVSWSALVRILLRWAQIPSNVPQELSQLDTFANSSKPPNRDGPQAAAFVRNRIVHPRRGEEVPARAIADAWLLTSWYLELVMLRILAYNGSYANRLVRNRWAGTVDPVPWVPLS